LEKKEPPSKRELTASWTKKKVLLLKGGKKKCVEPE